MPNPFYQFFDTTSAVLKKIQIKAPDEFGKALMQETKIEEKECKRITPLDKGPLEASVHAVGYERDGRSIVAAIVAGEPGSGAEDYALEQHENLDFFHKNGREAKYIERPLNASAPHMAARVARRIDLNKAKG